MLLTRSVTKDREIEAGAVEADQLRLKLFDLLDEAADHLPFCWLRRVDRAK